MAGRPVAAFAALTRDEEARVLHDLAAELEEQSAADDPAGDRA
jgi:hypothetical protein